ncbi:MAG TPA: prepilin-type N-terminal cleavage/methylation domain-containing protein [Candidatus Absconditabacterales bacterium]|nr:prepilin-type N-terminal cleavage/methylation domain-containing protein [Candidatus Absconditabacterales bacterium]
MIKKKAFTIVEIIMVVVIIGILSGILFKTYITISKVSFRIEQQKILNQELLFVSEVLQNMSDRNSIDYQKYSTGLLGSNGIYEILYLSGQDGEIEIYTRGNCLDDFGDLQENTDICSLRLRKNDQEIKLTNDGVFLSNVYFKIIPYANIDQYDSDSSCGDNYLACIANPGFWFLAEFYSIGYDGDNWTNNVSMFVQEFFNN